MVYTPKATHLRDREESRSGRKIMIRQPKLLDQVRDYMRVSHYALDTEKAYVSWIS
jgi:hypothetical protein